MGKVVRKSSFGLWFLGYIGFLLLYRIFMRFQWTDIKLVQAIMELGILSVLGFSFLAFGREKKVSDRQERIQWSIFVIGVIMRVGYTLYTPWYLRGHDVAVAALNCDGGDGHAAYLINLYYGHLPDSNAGQFYHPPLFHILGAVTMRIYGFIANVTEVGELVDAAKIVSCLAAIAALLQMKKLIREIGLTGTAANLVLLILACFPNFYLMGGRINNDSLSFFFMVVILRYTFLWYRNTNWKNTILLALAFGFGMMAKLTCAMMAFFTAIVMLVKLYHVIREKQWKPLLVKFVVFGCISGPLGLWYAIRNLLLFQQPLNYVLEMDRNSGLYAGDHSALERLAITHLHLFSKEKLFCDPYSDFNIPEYLLRSAVFGEFTHSVVNGIAILLYAVSIFVVVLSLISMVGMFVFYRQRTGVKLALLFVECSQLVSYVCVNFRYPFGCTMDYRYIPMTAVIGAVFIGWFYQEMKKKKNRWCGWYCTATKVLTGLFAISSIVMYTNIN